MNSLEVALTTLARRTRLTTKNSSPHISTTLYRHYPLTRSNDWLN